MGDSYTELIVWQKAMELVFAIYDATKAFPRSETYGLKSQIERAAVSIPSNIAEGQARYSQKDFANFLGHARGSLAELETQLMIARHLGYISEELSRELSARCATVGQMLNRLHSAIAARARRSPEV